MSLLLFENFLTAIPRAGNVACVIYDLYSPTAKFSRCDFCTALQQLTRFQLT